MVLETLRTFGNNFEKYYIYDPHLLDIITI